MVSPSERVLRFEELRIQSSISKIAPKNNILTFLMVHLQPFPLEDFLVFDAGRYLFGIHPAGKPWYTLLPKDASEKVRSETEKLSAAEQHYRELFRSFLSYNSHKERGKQGICNEICSAEVPKNIWWNFGRFPPSWDLYLPR